MNKILFVASVPEHIKAFHLPYLKWFKDMGYETHVACNSKLELPFIDKFWQVSFERSPFKKNNIKAYFQLKNLIEIQNYSLINCHTPVASVITRLASINSRKKRTKVIYTAHGFHFYEGASIKNWLLFYPIERFLTRYTDALITINTEDYNRIKAVGSSTCKYYLINGIGVDGKKFFPISNEEKQEKRNKFHFSNNDLILIYAAEFIHRKNHKFIIDTVKNNIAEFKGIKILFAGKGQLYEKLVKQVSQDKTDDKIIFLGFRSDIDEIYKISDYGLTSSLQEGLPINVVEEMLCGLPVIGTIERGHKELIENNVNGFLFPINNEGEFIKIINKIKNRELNYNELCENARRTSSKFELNNVLNQITNIYKEYLKNV